MKVLFGQKFRFQVHKEKHTKLFSAALLLILQQQKIT